MSLGRKDQNTRGFLIELVYLMAKTLRDRCACCDKSGDSLGMFCASLAASVGEIGIGDFGFKR